MTSRGRLFIITVLVLSTGFSVLFVTFLRGGFRDAILVPLFQGFNIIRFYVLRLPQQLLWAVPLLLVGALLVRVTFRALGPPAKRPARKRPGDRPVNELEQMAAVINTARYRPFYRKKVADELEKIATRMIARQESCPLDDARVCLKAGEWGDDPIVQAFFRTDKKKRRLARRTNHFNDQLRHTVQILERYSQGG
jgi:hypothetical protein